MLAEPGVQKPPAMGAVELVMWVPVVSIVLPF